MAKATFAIPGMRISGELWGAVLATQPDGTTVMRALPRRKPRRSAAQDAAAARLRPVGEAWRGLSIAEAEAWRRFAGGGSRAAYLAFTALATKCLQMRPDAPVPRLPPASPFGGDGIEVTARADEGAGTVVFAANGANAPGVTTEILLQRLASPHRTPVVKAYRGRRFVAFAPGARETALAVEPGTWACAVRFVREGTGQEGPVVELGVAVVGKGG